MKRLLIPSLLLLISCGIAVPATRAAGSGGSLRGLIAEHGHPSTLAQRAQSPLPADPNRVEHFVRPGDTDAHINQFLQDHYIMYNRAVRSNGKLFVFFAGTYGFPRGYQWILNEAARRGYRAIGLEYPDDTNDPNRSAVDQICADNPDPSCAGAVRYERVTGRNSSRKIVVTPANSIVHRLVALLQYLNRYYPSEHWGDFLNHGSVRWGKIAVGGHSQGAGMAAFIAKQHLVYRVALWSGGTDYIPAVPGFASWVGGNGSTPPSRFFGMVHRRESAYRGIVSGWDLLGMGRFGRPVRFTGRPMHGVHEVVVNGTPRPLGRMKKAYHSSTATDRATPIRRDGTPAYRLVWDDLLGP